VKLISGVDLYSAKTTLRGRMECTYASLSARRAFHPTRPCLRRNTPSSSISVESKTGSCVTDLSSFRAKIRTRALESSREHTIKYSVLLSRTGTLGKIYPGNTELVIISFV